MWAISSFPCRNSGDQQGEPFESPALAGCGAGWRARVLQVMKAPTMLACGKMEMVALSPRCLPYCNVPSAASQPKEWQRHDKEGIQLRSPAEWGGCCKASTPAAAPHTTTGGLTKARGVGQPFERALHSTGRVCHLPPNAACSQCRIPGKVSMGLCSLISSHTRPTRRPPCSLAAR